VKKRKKKNNAHTQLDVEIVKESAAKAACWEGFIIVLLPPPPPPAAESREEIDSSSQSEI